jgi:cytochrome c biogenesis protein CcdA/thiol-disulfide isomerase/thioredoxin
MSPLLLGVGFLGGLLTIVSPCILPVLPAVIASGVQTGGRRRAFAIAIGLALAFGFTSLFSIRVLNALHLPDGFRYDAAIVVLYILGVSFLIPRLSELIEKPFARIGLKRSPDATRSGFVLGATLGLLYIPCGGPILSTITAVGNRSASVGSDAVGLTVAYSLGIAVPIFVLVLLTERTSSATTWLRTNAVPVRRVGGVLLIASAVLITFGAATTLQKHVPGFVASAENKIAGPGTQANGDLSTISNPHVTKAGARIHTSLDAPATTPAQPEFDPAPGVADTTQNVSASSLHNYGQAPDFADVTKWLNTPNGSPLSLAQLRGKVVLIDFWTYSCVNCLRSLPHVEAWYSRYHSAGFEVIGVHTPEFDFERVPGNVESAVSRLGVKYPVEMDNNYGTWNAWDNNSWPAEYLIDPQGNVRYGSIGESDYGKTEGAIRALLAANGAKLPPPTNVPDRTPMEATTPESYLGYERLARYAGSPAVVHDMPTTYTFASSLHSSQLSYSGQWTVHAHDIVAGPKAALRVNVDAMDVYLVLSGKGTVTGTLSGKPVAAQHVSGVPRLYTIASGTTERQGILQLSVPQGVKAYAFTFG